MLESSGYILASPKQYGTPPTRKDLPMNVMIIIPMIKKKKSRSTGDVLMNISSTSYIRPSHLKDKLLGPGPRLSLSVQDVGYYVFNTGKSAFRQSDTAVPFQPLPGKKTTQTVTGLLVGTCLLQGDYGDPRVWKIHNIYLFIFLFG
jgi:hypothetical protein